MARMSMSRLVNKAKKVVVEHYAAADDVHNRKWLTASPPPAYENNLNRVEIHVLEGTPNRGYVLAFPHCAMAFDSHGIILRVYTSSIARWPEVSDATKIGAALRLANMVIDYFGDDPLDPRLDGDIALREAATDLKRKLTI